MKKRLLALSGILLLCAATLIYQKYFSRPHLTVVGYVKMADGLGRQTVELIDAFKHEMKVGFIPTHRNRYQDVPKHLHSILKNKRRPQGKVVLFEDCLWWPGHYPYQKLLKGARPDQIRIAYSMFESTRIPPEWTDILNTHFDAVAVPDPFLIKVYQESGVTVPIFVVPLAIDLSPFLQLPLKNKAKTPFTFGNLSTCVDRKNHITLIRAFAKAFGNDHRVRLIINARAHFNDLCKTLQDEIQTLGLTNIQFTVNSLSKQDYLDLFQTIDCYINLSKGEGFSIQPREAMALGIPTIVTSNTAQATIAASNLSVPVLSELQEPAYYDWGAYYGNFSLCTIDDAADAMLQVYDNYPFYLKKSTEARSWASQYQYDALKPYYRTLIKPKKVILGKANKITQDTLTTTSETLYKKYLHL